MMAIQLKPSLPIAEAFRQEYLEYYRMLPLEVADDLLRVAVAGEPHPDAMADLRDSYGVELEVIPVERDLLLEAIRLVFDANESMVELVRDLDASLGNTVELGDDIQVANCRKFKTR